MNGMKMSMTCTGDMMGSGAAYFGSAILASAMALLAMSGF
jgi:hypothetical protein